MRVTLPEPFVKRGMERYFRWVAITLREQVERAKSGGWYRY